MEISENRLLERIARLGKSGGRVLRGIGDDGAVVDVDGGHYVYVQDAMAEGVHFDLSFQGLRDVGRKAVNINVSDCFAMGAEPLYFMVTLGIPDRILSTQIDQLYRGIMRAADEFSLSLLGGDTIATKVDFFVDISMIGRLIVPKYLGRDQARAGHLIAVTGPLGESAHGLELLRRNPKTRTNRYVRRYRCPELPHALWSALVRTGIPRAMMDVSDGLLMDTERMMRESQTAAVLQLERIPVPPALRRQGKESVALSGGEDYQFLFTFDKADIANVKRLMDAYPSLSVIGEVKEGRGVHLLDRGKERRVTVKGYEHFRGAPE